MMAAWWSGCGANVRPVPSGGGVGATGGGAADAPPSLSRAFREGTHHLSPEPRGTGAGVSLQRSGDETLLLERFHDAKGDEWRRLTAPRWAYDERPGERLQSFVVHPSGEVTLALEQRDAPNDAYQLVRLDADGVELHRQALRSSALPAELFPMRGMKPGLAMRGWLPWVELKAAGEGVVAAVLTHTTFDDPSVASAVLSFAWAGAGWEERWAQVLDGRHALIAVAWQYDEFLWLDAATRLLLAVRDDGSIIVGRSVDPSRCRQSLSVQTCRGLSRGVAHRYQPFVWTHFSVDGTRGETLGFAPDGLEEFVVFDMAVRGGELALAGVAVAINPATGAPDPYVEPPDGTWLNPYDGYLAVVDATSGVARTETRVDQGRGELLSTVRWTDEGLLAGGGTGWNRWTGGMSVSRGAAPLLVLQPTDGGAPQLRTVAVPLVNRHAHVLTLDTRGGEVWAAGPFDAPMTHSGDGDASQLALGGFTLHLR